LTLLVGRQEGHPACKKTKRWGTGMVVRLERGADLHMAQLMPLPLTVSCFSKIQIGFTFLVPARAILVIFCCLYHCIIVSFIEQFSPSRLQVCSINSVQFSSDPGSPGQRAVKRYVCVCVCVCVVVVIICRRVKSCATCMQKRRCACIVRRACSSAFSS